MLLNCNAQSFLHWLQTPFKPGMDHNVLLNPNTQESFTHIELERETVRLEFATTKDPIFQQYVQHFTRSNETRSLEYRLGYDFGGDDLVSANPGLNDEVQILTSHDKCGGAGANASPSATNLEIVDVFLPAIKDIRNNTFCGAGATVFIHRKTATKLLERAVNARLSSSESLAISRKGHAFTGRVQA